MLLVVRKGISVHVIPGILRTITEFRPGGEDLLIYFRKGKKTGFGIDLRLWDCAYIINDYGELYWYKEDNSAVA